jgi:hypothetical protein
LVRLSILPSGNFTGLVDNGGPIPLRGQFAADGSYHRTFQYGAKAVVIDLAGGADSLTGTISIAGTSYAAAVDRLTFSAVENPAPAAQYTLFFPAPTAPSPAPAGFPQGYGRAAVHIAPSGRTLVVGRLGDTTGLGRSTVISSAGFLSKNRQFSLYTALYGSRAYYHGVRGQVAGVLTFTPVPAAGTSDVTGTLAWAKPAEDFPFIHNAAFDVDLKPTGSIYHPPAAGTRLLAGLDARGDLEADLKAGLLSGTLSRNLRLLPNNTVIAFSVGYFDNFRFAVDPRNGVFTGTFLHTSFFPNYLPYSGVFLQKQGFGRGTFPGSSVNSSGSPLFAGGKVEVFNSAPAQ